MKRYVLLLGGTGARIADALLAACAAGVIPAEKLEVLLADTDRRGVRSASLVGAKVADYEHIRAAMAQNRGEGASSGPFSAQVLFSAWPRTLPGDADTLAQWTAGHEDDALLCQALFDADAADIDLHEGFHGRRMLGDVTFAALLHQADQDMEDPLSCLVDDMVQSARDGEEVRVVVVGSICGGTGAAGFPALCRYIRHRTGDGVHLGAILLGANTEAEDARVAHEALSTYARDGLCDTIGLLALPAASRNALPVEVPQLTDWLAVYMLDVLLHRPEWLRGLFTVRAEGGPADWHLFGGSASRYRIAFGQLMKVAAAWQYVLSPRVEKGLRHPSWLRDGLFGWYAHFFRRVQDREEQLALMSCLDRLMGVLLLWMGGVARSVPVDMRCASALQAAREEGTRHYAELISLEGQLAIMDDDAQRNELYEDNLVYRRGSAAAEENEQAIRRIDAVKQQVLRLRAEQSNCTRRMGGTAAMTMLEDALEQACRDQDELNARRDEVLRRIDHAQEIAAAQDQYRIDDARVKLQRVERHARMLQSRVNRIQADMDAARERGVRFVKPAVPAGPAQSGLFLPEVAEKLLQRDSLSRKQVELLWPRMVCPGETATLQGALKAIRRVPAHEAQPLMRLLEALLTASMQMAQSPKEAKR